MNEERQLLGPTSMAILRGEPLPGQVQPVVGRPICGKSGCCKPAVAEILLSRHGAFYEAYACDDHRGEGATIGEFVKPNKG